MTSADPNPSAPRVFRGALIGLGGIARQSHLPALLGDPRITPRLRIVATVDEAPGVRPLEGVPHYETTAQLSAAAPLDFVDICTRTASHFPLTLWALEQGFHVLCEKPVALTRHEADQVTAAARAAGRVVVPCHQYRHNPVWRQVQDWLVEGVIGRWHLAEIDVYRPGADRGSIPSGTPWRGLAEESRGGILLDHGTHLLYQLLDAGGMPEFVRAWTGRLRHGDYSVEDSAQVMLEYPERLAKIFLTWAARHRENRIRFVGDEGMIEWVGGALRMEHQGVEASYDRSAELEKSAYASWFGGLFADFIAAMDGGGGEHFLADIGRVATLLELSYESAQSGARLSVPR